MLNGKRRADVNQPSSGIGRVASVGRAASPLETVPLRPFQRRIEDADKDQVVCGVGAQIMFVMIVKHVDCARLAPVYHPGHVLDLA
jgi:hypothetical protein